MSNTLNATRVATRLDKEIWVGDPSYGTTLAAAVTAISTTACTLHLAAGTHTVSANLTIPANIALAPEKGATISHGSYTVTVNGPIFAGAYQIFSGAGTVTLAAAVNPWQYGVWTGGTALIFPGETTFSAAATFNAAASFTDAVGFSAFPTTPSAAPDADYEVANKKYVDDSVGAVSTGYALSGIEGIGFDPSDGTTYYFGAFGSASGYTTADLRRVYVPKAGTITAITVYFWNQTVLGTAETSSIYLRLNNTTDTLISNAVVNNAVSTAVNNTALSIAVTAGNYFEIKWITPTWVTNPTSVNLSVAVYIT